MIYRFLQYSLEQGHALANFASQRILSEKHSSCVFRKYRRAQITPYFRPTLHLSLHLLVFTILHLVSLLHVPTGLDCPHFRPMLHLSLLLLVFIVLHFVGSPQVPASSDTSFFRPILHCRFIYWFLRFFTQSVCCMHRQAQISHITDLYCIYRFISQNVKVFYCCQLKILHAVMKLLAHQPDRLLCTTRPLEDDASITDPPPA